MNDITKKLLSMISDISGENRYITVAVEFLENCFMKKFLIILFVLVGAAVDIRYTMQAGIAAVLMIFVGLMFRAVGVSLCMLGTKLNKKERLFCVIAYLPKATVQAAIGSVLQWDCPVARSFCQ